MSYSCKTVAASPVGDLKIVANEKGLVAVLWPNDDPARVRLLAATENSEHPILLEAERQLTAYLPEIVSRSPSRSTHKGQSFKSVYGKRC